MAQDVTGPADFVGTLLYAAHDGLGWCSVGLLLQHNAVVLILVCVGLFTNITVKLLKQQLGPSCCLPSRYVLLYVYYTVTVTLTGYSNH
jgi:hypothetical protein